MLERPRAELLANDSVLVGRLHCHLGVFLAAGHPRRPLDHAVKEGIVPEAVQTRLVLLQLSIIGGVGSHEAVCRVNGSVCGFCEVNLVHPVHVFEAIGAFGHVEEELPCLQEVGAVDVERQTGFGVYAIEVENGTLAVHLHALLSVGSVGDQERELLQRAGQVEVAEILALAVLLTAVEVLGLIEDALVLGNDLRFVDHEQDQIVVVNLFGKLHTQSNALGSVIQLYWEGLDLLHIIRHLEVFFLRDFRRHLALCVRHSWLHFLLGLHRPLLGECHWVLQPSLDVLLVMHCRSA